MSEADVERNKRCKELGICTTCHNRQAVPDMSTCERCLLWFAERRKKRASNGECPWCGHVHDGIGEQGNCTKCQEKQENHNRHGITATNYQLRQGVIE